MSPWADRFAAFKASGDAAPLRDAIPYARFLGVSLSTDDEGVLATLPFSDHVVGNPALPALHGGTLGALLEIVSVFQVIWTSDTIILPRVINLTVDYMRSARQHDTFARAIVTKQGRRVINVRAEAWQEDRSRVVCATQAHFLVKTMDGDDAPLG